MPGRQTREENADEMSYEERRQQILEADCRLSGPMLDSKYNQDGDAQHPLYQRSRWREQVSLENTISGYWDWVSHMVREAHEGR